MDLHERYTVTYNNGSKAQWHYYMYVFVLQAFVIICLVVLCNVFLLCISSILGTKVHVDGLQQFLQLATSV